MRQRSVFHVFIAICGGASAQFHQFANGGVADNGLLTGFKMRWTMDEITSADLLYDAGNAKPGSEIWKNWRRK
jgi:ABC-type uncharacterized transport system substrate-binding protein